MSQRQRLQDFFSRLPRPLRISLLLLLLASTGLTLALPLEFQSSVMGYLSALVQDWPLLVSGAIAWAFLIIARRRKWDWRWVATPAMIHGLIACGKGMRQLDEVTSGAHTAWGNAVIVALILGGLGLTLLGLGAWQPLLTRVAEALKRTRAEEKKARKGDWTDTEIVEAADDRFGFRDCVGVLANRAATADTPLTIGIFGRWGSGKTSLMKLMQKRAGGKPAVKTLWINVWQLSNQEELWNAFLQALLTRVHKELPFFRRLAFDWRLLRERVDRGALLRQLLVNSYRIVVVVTPLLLALFWPAPLPADANQLLAVILDPWTGGGASLFLGLWLLLKPVVEAAKEKVSLDLDTVLKEAPYEAQVSALQQLQSQFERMVKAWVGKDGRLVVFIDDLDRCSPDKVPEVLEALKLFTTTHGCVYVLGLDHDVVRKAVAAKYNFSQDEGAEYLEKIVQIPFHLPPLGVHRIEVFVREGYPDVCKKCPPAPRVFSLGLEPNPRKVKRALNIYRTLLELAEVRVNAWEMDPVESELVAKMVVIQSRFRGLYEYLVKYPAFLGKVEAKALPEDGLDSKALRDDQDVGWILLGKPETKESEAEPGLIEETGLAALNDMLRAGERQFSADDQRNQISSYIYLTGAAESGAERVRPNRKEREALLGEDPAKIRDQVDEILKRGAGEQAQQRITQAYIKRLEGVLRGDRYTAAERVSANIALDLLEGWTRQEFEPQTVRIPAGPFLMGSSDDEAAGDAEKPQHTVELATYRIGRYPVTNAEYQVFVRDTGHGPPQHWDGEDYPEGKDDHPVAYVSWHDALAYCKWLSEKTGKPYRLPTEAEWEKAARGTDGRIYPWGNEWDETKLNSGESGPGDTTPVGQYSPGGDSPYGAADMAGNVWEWCATKWVDNYRDYDANEDNNLEGDAPRVLRGGAFLDGAGLVRCAYRNWNLPDSRRGSYGFRVVASPVTSEL